MRSFEVSSLWCPIPAAIRPDWEVLERQTNAWVERFQLNADDTLRARIPKIGVGELAARTSLDAQSLATAQFSADVLIWLIAFDDRYCDEGRYRSRPGEMAIFAAELARVADTGETSSSEAYVRALADLRRRVDGLCSPVAAARWASALRSYFQYQVWEAAFRSAGTIPTLDEYVVARIQNGAMEVCTMSLDIAGGYEVPAAEMSDPHVRALTEMCCAMVGLDNDLVSYHKEQENGGGDTMNIVDVIANERQISVREAAAQALQLRNAILARYLEQKSQVVHALSWEGQRYVSGLSAWIRGNLDWSFNSDRYRVSDVPFPAIVATAPAIVPVTTPSSIRWWWSRGPRGAETRTPLMSASVQLTS